MASPDWMVSLHGGHSGDYCEHASGTLREMIERAIAVGYQTFGVSEHAPRDQERFLYDSEREKGYDVARLAREFDYYGEAVRRLAYEYEDRITVLRGFEAEVVPTEDYAVTMRGLYRLYEFDYIVGSVHFVNEISIDGSRSAFDKAVESCGGLEALCIRYYEDVADMIEALQPHVVGHLDLVRRNAPEGANLATRPIREAAEEALEAAREYRAILDLNTAGWRKDLGGPYPAPWLVRRANAMGIPFCFGDDSHSPREVGSGIDEAREYLLKNGVNSIACLVPGETVSVTTIGLDP